MLDDIGRVHGVDLVDGTFELGSGLGFDFLDVEEGGALGELPTDKRAGYFLAWTFFSRIMAHFSRTYLMMGGWAVLTSGMRASISLQTRMIDLRARLAWFLRSSELS